MRRYKELKIGDIKIYNENEIDKVLISNSMSWILDAEIKNARLEIVKKTLIWNAGIWYNGVWKYGVFRSGQWSCGIWENGVWYNGIWKTGTFKNGIIYGGEFIGGEILKGTIMGGNFHEINILTNVKNEIKKMAKIVENNRMVMNNNPIIDNADTTFVEATLANMVSKNYIYSSGSDTNISVVCNNNETTNSHDPYSGVDFPSADDLKTFK